MIRIFNDYDTLSSFTDTVKVLPIESVKTSKGAIKLANVMYEHICALDSELRNLTVDLDTIPCNTHNVKELIVRLHGNMIDMASDLVSKFVSKKIEVDGLSSPEHDRQFFIETEQKFASEVVRKLGGLKGVRAYFDKFVDNCAVLFLTACNLINKLIQTGCVDGISTPEIGDALDACLTKCYTKIFKILITIGCWDNLTTLKTEHLGEYHDKIDLIWSTGVFITNPLEAAINSQIEVA